MTSLFMHLTLIAGLIGGNGVSAPDAAPRPTTSADSASAPDYTPSLSSWNMTPQAASRARFWSNAGYGQIAKQYGPNSELIDAGGAAPLPTSLVALANGLGVTLPLPEGVDGTVQGASARISGNMSVVNVHVGGAYEVLRRSTFAVTLGADLGFSQQNFQADRITFDVDEATVSIPALGVEDAPLSAVAAEMNLEIPASVSSDRAIQSGFAAQSLTLFTEIEKRAFSGRIGYQFDLGPSPNLDLDRRENTDRQDAVLFGLGARKGHEAMIFFGGVDAYVTLPAQTGEYQLDAGNVYGLNAGVGYQVGIAEFGTAVTLRYRTEGTSLLVSGGQAYSIPAPAGHHLGVAPYISVAPAGRSFSAYVKGGVQDEYRDYTLSITGENDFAPTAGATFGIVYGL